MRTPEVDALTAQLVEALRAAHAVRRGLPSELEQLVRTYARAHREGGTPIQAVLIEVKALVRDHTAFDEGIFTPKVVGWTVAGYFHGTKPTG